MFIKGIYTETTINASPEKIWLNLVDLKRYKDWNPFIIEARGKVQEGSRLKIKVKPPGSRGLLLHPRITVSEKCEELGWRESLYIPGLFDGYHLFKIKPGNNGKSRLIHKCLFKGLLVPFLKRRICSSKRCGFDGMNDALKYRVEKAITG